MQDYDGLKICWNCKFATIDYTFDNLDIEGNPTLVTCSIKSERKHIRTEDACNKFVFNEKNANNTNNIKQNKATRHKPQ